MARNDLDGLEWCGRYVYLYLSVGQKQKAGWPDARWDVYGMAWRTVVWVGPFWSCPNVSQQRHNVDVTRTCIAGSTISIFSMT